MFWYNSSATIRNCKIIGNHANVLGGGICISSGSFPIFENCLIANNYCEYYNDNAGAGGGGVSVVGQNARAEFVNCIVTGNIGAGSPNGDGIALRGDDAGAPGEVIIRNSIVYGNGGINLFISQGRLPANNTFNVTYSDVGSGWQGTGNIDADPIFVDIDNNDFHLQSISPCIDTGDPNSAFNNEPQPNGNRINMGAYGNSSEATVNAQLHSIPRQTYVMMGIPLMVTNGNQATLFQDDFGGGNPGETWRCSRWSVANQEYARYGEAGSGDPADFVPGNGYWMNTTVANCVLNIPDNLDDGHVAQDARYVHDLESVTDGNRGINQIANPFHYSYDWRNTSFYNSTTDETKSIADAATGGWINGYAYTYDYVNSQYVAVNWTGETNYTIDTWQGFWCEVLITDGMQARFQPNGYAG